MIESLTLINWRSHASTRLDFRAGTNLIIGIMGSGKSSVLDGISFGLFGTFPSLERRKLKLDDLIRLNETTAKITLQLTYNKNTYRLERSIERNKRGTSTSAELFKNGSLLEHGSSAVTTYIQGLLSIDYDLFTRAIYCEQNNMDHFLELDPRKRKAELDSLLGLDKFEIARSNLVTLISRNKNRREDLSFRFDQKQKDSILLSIKEKTASTSALKEQILKLNLAFSELKSNHQLISDTYSKLRDRKAQFESLSKDMSQLSGRILALESESLDFDPQKVLDLKEDLSNIEKSQTEQSSMLKNSSDDIFSKTKELAALEAIEKSRLQLVSKINDLKNELALLLGGSSAQEFLVRAESLQKDVLENSTLINSLEREISEIKEILPKMKDGAVECPICSNQLSQGVMVHLKDEKENLISKKQEQILSLKQKLSLQKTELDKVRQVHNRVVLILDVISNYEKQVSSSSDETAKIHSLKSDIIVLQTKKDDLTKSTSLLLSRFNLVSLELSKLLLLEKKSKDLVHFKAQMIKLQEQLQVIDFDPNVFESTRSEIEKISLSIERLSSQIRAADADIKRNQEILLLLENDLNKMLLLETEIKEAAALEEELLLFRNALLSTQVSLRNDLVGAINLAMNEIWSIFYPYRNYSSIRVVATEKDYLFELESFGSWKNLESLASGGERASFALVFRVALSIVLSPKISLILLDEPTHNLDRSAVELLSNTLQFKVPEVIEQAFVITHEEGLMGSEFGSSYRFIRDKSIEGETKVERI
ncbi:MAG: AAA family ATPase [Candidatus Bilamarchaeum sp.]